MTVFDDWCAKLTLAIMPRRKRQQVGQDEMGNIYMQAGKRRWVVYAREVEASAVPPGWHAWLHRQTDTPPTMSKIPKRDWYLPHRPNRTGTAEAYYPPGHLLAGGQRDPATGDYEAWRPDAGTADTADDAAPSKPDSPDDTRQEAISPPLL
ncbi:MAG: NADH-ubiquinone oxidoreductase subunit NDUFA12 family protein [Pseudomonadota bacterium]